MFKGTYTIFYLIKTGEKHEQNLPYAVFHPVLLRIHIVSSSRLGHHFILSGAGRTNIKLPMEFVMHENKITENFKFRRFKTEHTGDS